MIYGFLEQANENQPGDPDKAVKIMIDIVKEEGVAQGKTQPLRLPIGRDALATLRNKYVKYLELCDEWEDVITSTDFDVPDVKAITTVQGHEATVLWTALKPIVVISDHILSAIRGNSYNIIRL